MGKFYGHKPQQTESGSPACTVIRFVLKSGAALELKEDTIHEVIGGWADRVCNSLAGCKVDGTRCLIPVGEISYMEEAQ